MLRRALAVLSATVAVLALAAVPANAATIRCRPAASSPTCLVWTGKVSWVPDGDTPLIDVHGDGTAKAKSIRLIGVQAMEQSVYHPTPSRRRGECHALAATARVEQLVRAAGGVVRMTAQKASSTSRGRSTALHKYWGSTVALFANPTFDAQAIGDGGYLFDPRGNLRAWMHYPCVVACR